MPLVDYLRSLAAAAITFREAERIQHPVRRLLHELARVRLKKYRKAVSSTRGSSRYSALSSPEPNSLRANLHYIGGEGNGPPEDCGGIRVSTNGSKRFQTSPTKAMLKPKNGRMNMTRMRLSFRFYATACRIGLYAHKVMLAATLVGPLPYAVPLTPIPSGGPLRSCWLFEAPREPLKYRGAHPGGSCNCSRLFVAPRERRPDALSESRMP